MDLPYEYEENSMSWKYPKAEHNELYLGGVPKRLENGWETKLTASPVLQSRHMFSTQI